MPAAPDRDDIAALQAKPPREQLPLAPHHLPIVDFDRRRARQPIEQVGRELREMMTFLKKKKETGVPEDQPALAARK